MRLFESEIQQQNNFPPRGHQQPFRPPAFMPSSVRAHHGGFRGRGMHHGGGGPPHNGFGGDVPPPPSYPRPQYIHNPNPVNQFNRSSKFSNFSHLYDCSSNIYVYIYIK